MKNRIGLKLWNTNIDYYYNEAIKLYHEGIFSYIELYIVPGNLDKIDKWKNIGIPFDIHAPHFAFDVNLSKKECYDYNYRLYLETKKFADELESNIIVYHGGTNGDYKETARQIKLFDDKRILIENKPLRLIERPDDEYCIGAKYDEIKYIIENTGCGFCLDIGHAICSANAQLIEPYSYIEKLLTLNPKRIHLSDIYIDSIRDMHLNYGNGNLDIERVVSMVGDNVPITIETNKKSKIDLNDYKNDVVYLKQKYGNMVLS